MKLAMSEKPRGTASIPFWTALKSVFDEVQCERRFDWLQLPNGVDGSKHAKKIRDALIEDCKFRRETHRNIKKRECSPEALAMRLENPVRPKLEFDFFIPSLNLAFDFDERQHFTVERAVSLRSYDEGIHVSYSTDEWIKRCDRIRAVDTDPVSRDWERAYRDAMRDICASENGITIVRFAFDDVPSQEDLMRRFLPA